MVEAAVKDGLLSYEADPAKYEEEEDEDAKPSPNDKKTQGEKNPAEEETSVATVKTCKRPWWVCQPYVRPLLKEALEKGSLTMSKKDRRRQEEAAAVIEKKEEILDGDKKLVEGSRTGMTDREKRDEDDGLDRKEMPKESMVCG